MKKRFTLIRTYQDTKRDIDLLSFNLSRIQNKRVSNPEVLRRLTNAYKVDNYVKNLIDNDAYLKKFKNGK